MYHVPMLRSIFHGGLIDPRAPGVKIWRMYYEENQPLFPKHMAENCAEISQQTNMLQGV